MPGATNPALTGLFGVAFGNGRQFTADTAPRACSSRDAALVTTLTPGNYSVRATGVANTTGVALVEVYELR